MLFQKKQKADKEQLAMAQKLDGMHVKYAVERLSNNEDEVIGKEGCLNFYQNQIILFANEKVLFRADLEKVTISELLSHDGTFLEGTDAEHENQFRRIIAYYLYYR